MNNNTGLPAEGITATFFNQREYQIQRKNHFSIQFNSDFIPKGLELLVVSFHI